jgi:myotubularin-related protein 5/13
MERFADYFAVAGFNRAESGDESPSILQRFPSSEWKDVAFPQGIELFCQPLGWKTSDIPYPPMFFTSVLTDVEGQRAYCACLSFSESVTKPQSQSCDGDKIQDKTEYQTKTICIVARHPFLKLLKGCLCLVYSQFVHCSVSNPPESLIGRILSFGLAPLDGSGVVKYNLGCGEVLELRQVDKNNNLPYTGTAVAQVFQILGLQNTIRLFCATVAENRILFHSNSFSLLGMVANALLALLFPLTMSYPFIPILPDNLIEFLSAPTPFIMGIHSSSLPSSQDLNEVVVVDIDGGTVMIPDGVVVPELPKFLSKSFHRMLLMIFNPGLLTADIAFKLPNQQPNLSERERDKAARALFLHLFAELFRGYRLFLTVGRMHPEPFIEFNKVSCK